MCAHQAGSARNAVVSFALTEYEELMTSQHRGRTAHRRRHLSTRLQNAPLARHRVEHIHVLHESTSIVAPVQIGPPFPGDEAVIREVERQVLESAPLEPREVERPGVLEEGVVRLAPADDQQVTRTATVHAGGMAVASRRHDAHRGRLRPAQIVEVEVVQVGGLLAAVTAEHDHRVAMLHRRVQVDGLRNVTARRQQAPRVRSRVVLMDIVEATLALAVSA